MSKYYLYVMPSDFIQQYISYDQPRINLSDVPTKIQVDDRILPTEAINQNILPFVYRIASINHSARTATIQLEEVYNRTVSVEEVFLGHSTGVVKDAVARYIPLKIVDVVFSTVLNKLGGKRMEEKDLLDYIHRYIAAKGYYFDTETLYNYHICLKTRPFVILAGLSGTGKSKLTQLYAEALGHRSHYLRLPVRPNWTDDRYLLGHLNVITGEYMTEPAVEFVMEAGNDQDNLYFFCLDEMNLAHVEYYFSQFLSAMEEEQPKDRRITLLSKRAQKQLEELGKAADVPAELLIPTNLFFTGTINVDETTQPVSDKVIDRANTLEFFNVDLEKIPEQASPPEPIGLSTFTWKSYQERKPDTTYRSLIVEINTILKKADLGLGYRVLHEIELYLANSKNLLAPEVALDLQVKQRILPRVRGTQIIEGTLNDLLAFTKTHNLPRSEQRLNEMKSRLTRDGYTSFWR